MVIAQGIDKRIGICDIECYHELFDVGCYDPDTGKWVEFEVSKWVNELDKFVKWYTSKPCDYLVTFNGIGYDQQVLQFVVDNYQKWYDLTNLQITQKIADFSGKVIDDSNYGLPPAYREYQFSIPALDVFRIHHFDNKARKTSLKWCAFMLNMDVEEMPVPFYKKGLTREEVADVRKYRRNDVLVTKGVLELTLGKIDLPELKDYKGKNKIQDRFDVQKETGMKCLNWSDVKIGEEWNKLNYIKLERIKDERDLYPKKVVYPYGKRFSKYFPKSTRFTTPLMQKFIKEMGATYVKNEKQEFPLHLGVTSYIVAKGGIHSNEKYRFIIPPPGWTLRDADVGGQYPRFIIKEKVYPPHLNETIIEIADNNVKKRPILKAEAARLEAEGKKDEARPLIGLQEMLKLCNNGGLFGKLGQEGSFLEYPEGLLRVCIGCEIEILMLIEMMEAAGFQVVSGNTDGIMVLFPNEREKEYKEVCEEWQRLVGNTEVGKLEFADFTGLWQDGINSYIGKKTDGKVKKKGAFMTEFEINKNKSKRIIPLALEKYFVEGIDPITYIRSHKNIYDFCIAKKATGDMHYEEQWEENGITYTKVHKKLVRYFVSTKGTVLYKRGTNNQGNAMNNHCNAETDLGQPLVTYFNRGYDSNNYGVDYNHYILEVLERIDKIEKTKKADAFVKSLAPTIQGSLF